MSGHLTDSGCDSSPNSNCVQNGTNRGSSSLSKGNDVDKVCRDFLRNVCHRGHRCKYKHPKDVETEPSTEVNQKRSELTFCHDYQNNRCTRSGCRFIHCSCWEEEQYLETGIIPPHILDQAICKGQVPDTQLSGPVPICKDFLLGECSKRRGGKCKFRHMSRSAYIHEIYGLSRCDHGYFSDENVSGSGMTSPDFKRKRLEGKLPSPDFMREPEFPRAISENSQNHMNGDSLREYRDRERDSERDKKALEAILFLRSQVEEMKKEISVLKKENCDLQAMNKFLLEKKWSNVPPLGKVAPLYGKPGADVATVTVPTVSLVSTIPVAATSVQPLTAAQVSHPLSITSDCSVGSVMAIPPPHTSIAPPPAQPTAQPLVTQQVGVAAPPPAVVGSVGGVQVSLSQAPALTAVSLSTVALNPQIASATSMAPSIAAPGPGQSMAQAMSISGTSGHLVSYPIMTQPGMRPQLQ